MNQPMNGFSLTTGETNIVLSQAILIYTDDNKRSHAGSGTEAVYATVNPVENFGTDANPNFQIAAGRPVSREALLLMFKELAKQHSLNTDIIPENVLSISADHMVWWLPAGERNVFFNNKELGKRAAKVPHPALMFAVVKGQWYIFALEKNERPTAETALQFAPYSSGSARDLGQRHGPVGEGFLRKRIHPHQRQQKEINSSSRRICHVEGAAGRILPDLSSRISRANRVHPGHLHG
jgi:hypothetical protein